MNLFTFGEMKDPTRLSGPIDPEGGILIDLHIGPSPVDEDRMRASGVNVLPMRPIRAMVDPGSNRSMVQGSVLDEMGLMTYREVALASHDVEGEYKALYSYLVFLRIEGGGGHIDFLNIEVAPHGNAAEKAEMLIGRDILRFGRLMYDGVSGSFALEFPPYIGAIKFE